MLESIFILLTIAAFCMVALSFIPLGKQKQRTLDATGPVDIETQYHIPIFAWVACGLFFVLALNAMNINNSFCDNGIKAITNTSYSQNYTYAWSCYASQTTDENLAMLYYVFAILSFVYACLISFMGFFGNLAGKIQGIEQKPRY